MFGSWLGEFKHWVDSILSAVSSRWIYSLHRYLRVGCILDTCQTASVLSSKRDLEILAHPAGLLGCVSMSSFSPSRSLMTHQITSISFSPPSRQISIHVGINTHDYKPNPLSHTPTPLNMSIHLPRNRNTHIKHANTQHLRFSPVERRHSV